MGMIDVVQLTKRFDDIVAVDQLSLDIGEGVRSFFESLRRAQDARANWVHVADG